MDSDSDKGEQEEWDEERSWRESLDALVALHAESEDGAYRDLR